MASFYQCMKIHTSVFTGWLSWWFKAQGFYVNLDLCVKTVYVHFLCKKIIPVFNIISEVDACNLHHSVYHNILSSVI